MMSSVICSLYYVLLNGLIKEDEIGRTCSTHGTARRGTYKFSLKREGKEGLDVCGRKMCGLTSSDSGQRPVVGFCEHGLHKMKNSRAAKYLVVSH
jgi:hypothetical protein